MQGNKFAVSYNFPGTLAANQVVTFRFPFAVTLLGVSIGAQNDSDATIEVGTAGDPNGYLTAAVIGDSGVSVLYDRDDWDGALLPSDHVSGVDHVHIPKNTDIEVTLDYDGSSGTAAQNVTLCMIFCEG